MQAQVVPVPNPGEQAEAKQRPQSEYRQRLALVSACTWTGWMPESWANRKSSRYTASDTPHGMKWENNAM